MGMVDVNENVLELFRREYEHRVNGAGEDEWFKGEVVVSIHSVQGSSIGYFKAWLNQKEKQLNTPQLEII
jgi:hypothetical protein